MWLQSSRTWHRLGIEQCQLDIVWVLFAIPCLSDYWRIFWQLTVLAGYRSPLRSGRAMVMRIVPIFGYAGCKDELIYSVMVVAQWFSRSTIEFIAIPNLQFVRRNTNHITQPSFIELGDCSFSRNLSQTFLLYNTHFPVNQTVDFADHVDRWYDLFANNQSEYSDLTNIERLNFIHLGIFFSVSTCCLDSAYIKSSFLCSLFAHLTKCE